MYQVFQDFGVFCFWQVGNEFDVFGMIDFVEVFDDGFFQFFVQFIGLCCVGCQYGKVDDVCVFDFVWYVDCGSFGDFVGFD